MIKVVCERLVADAIANDEKNFVFFTKKSIQIMFTFLYYTI